MEDPRTGADAGLESQDDGEYDELGDGAAKKGRGGIKVDPTS